MFGDFPKYVIIESEFGAEVPVLLPNHRPHGSVVKPHESVVSAGFFDIGENLTVCCFGKSTSLNKESRPDEDARLIKKMLFPR